MTARFFRGFAAAALAVATLLAVAQTTVRPGQYEITIELRLPDLPQPITETRTECVTPEEAADFFRGMRADMSEAEADGETCKLSDPVVSGNKVTWDSDCEGKVTAKSEVTMTPDGFSGVIRTVSDGQVVPFNLTARWVGATCTDDGDDE